jgi:hypothetical protein
MGRPTVASKLTTRDEAEVGIDAQSAASLADTIEVAAKAIDEARQDADGRPLAVRVRVACAPDVYRKVVDRLEQFRFELAAAAGHQVWVEKIKPQCGGETEKAPSAIMGDAASELRATLAEFGSDPDAVKDIFAAGDFGKLRKVLPTDLRNFLDDRNYDDIFDLASVLLSAGRGEEDQ